MSVKLHIPQFLKHLTNEVKVIDVQGTTVGECLKDFVGCFPGAEELLFDKNGKILSYIDVYVNGGSAYPEELRKSVHDGDEIFIIFLISGG